MNLKLCRKVSSQLQLYANKKVFTLASCLFPFFQLDHVVFLLFHSHVYIRGHYQHHERKSPFRKSHHLKVEEKQICKKYCQHLSDSICLCLQNDAFFKVNKRIYLSVYLRLMSVKMKKFSSFLSLATQLAKLSVSRVESQVRRRKMSSKRLLAFPAFSGNVCTRWAQNDQRIPPFLQCQLL